uniref:Uncharacterized protein n=2 Tax=Salix viminalis TaxID=40686 RepID=A0A6N2LW13_SALVM
MYLSVLLPLFPTLSSPTLSLPLNNSRCSITSLGPLQLIFLLYPNSKSFFPKNQVFVSSLNRTRFDNSWTGSPHPC